MNMEKTKNTICAPPMNAAASPMARILSDVRWLMAQPRGSLVWMGTQRDLVEMVNIAWMQRAVIDSQGRPCTRKAMADRIFSVVGRPTPNHIARIVSRIGERCSPDLSMLARYARLAGECDIIHHFIK